MTTSENSTWATLVSALWAPLPSPSGIPLLRSPLKSSQFAGVKIQTSSSQPFLLSCMLLQHASITNCHYKLPLEPHLKLTSSSTLTGTQSLELKKSACICEIVNWAAMVKLTSARQSRMYGPPGTRDVFESLNAFLYLLGTVILAAGVVLLLPSFGAANTGLWMVLVGVAVVVVVNFHDLHAHLAGIDYNFRFLALDAQLWVVELAAPLVQAFGSILLCIAAFLLIRANKGVYDHQEIHLKLVQAFRLVVAGAALWLLGAIHNAFQVYEKTGLRVQVLQKAVSLPCVLASELLLISGVLALQISGRGHKLMRISTWLALVASGLLVLAAVLNVVRVVALQQVDRFGAHLESLRGGAEEQLQSSRAHSEPLLSSKGKYQSDIEGDQSSVPYRGSVVLSDSLPR